MVEREWYNLGMKIKKPIKVSPAEGGAAPGGAAIADRFRLDAAPQAAKPKGATVSSKAAAFAFAFGTLALALLGFLVWMLYQHAEYMATV